MTTKEFKMQDALGLMSTAAKYNAASNIHTPVGILEILSKHTDSYIRHLVALNPTTTKEMLETFLKDKALIVRAAANENPNTYWFLPRVLMKAVYIIKNISWHKIYKDFKKWWEEDIPMVYILVGGIIILYMLLIKYGAFK